VSTTEFNEFVRQEWPTLVAFVRRASDVTLEQAQDAVQDALIKAYPEWSTILHPRAWLRLVAQRIAQREVARSKTGLLRAVVGGYDVTTHHDPDIAVLHSEHDDLLCLLRRLPRRRRLVMAWHLDGFDNEEIAEQLGMVPATVRSNLRHARIALKAQYQARHE
jgi:RNA polymerase sigma factor (sigma-70 family)